MDQTPSKLYPSLIGGALIGLLSSLPIIAAGNCFCCMWVLIGGLLAGKYYCKSLAPGIEFKSGDGAVVGLLSGIFGALFATFISYVFQSMGMQNMDFIQQILDSSDEIPNELESLLREMQTRGGLTTAMAFIQLMMRMFTFSLFGMLGGILSTRFFKNTKTPRETQTTIL